jgi:L-arabinokinase
MADSHHGFRVTGPPAWRSLADTQTFLGLLARLRDGGASSEEERAAAALFDWSGELHLARAPGRLDAMGGIADYSGSLVLQLPTAEACHAVAQAGPGDGLLRVVSLGSAAGERAFTFEVAARALLDEAGAPLALPAARAVLEKAGAVAGAGWARYPLGVLHVLAVQAGARWTEGLRILLSSAVPEGKGVSSSAAVEVATMSAVASAAGLSPDGRTSALWCQLAENHVVGAPCGVMDQMASSLGSEGALLALLCRPAEVLGCVALPPGVRLWGLDSGVRHSVGGSDYSSVRAGAFMGLTMCRSAAVSAGRPPPPHLTSLQPAAFERDYAPALPLSLSAADFLATHADHGDAVTRLQPGASYAIRHPAAHPVHEHHRVQLFRALLAAPPGDEQLALLGELMCQSHESYSRCGLGSSGTDALVALVQELGPGRGLFGAKITGGGSGGTVCVLGRDNAEAEEAVQEVVARYAQAAGLQPYVFRGSSPGASTFGCLRLLPAA